VVARISASGAAAWYLPDRLGSLRDVTDATGAIQDHVIYDGFGNVVNESNPSFGDRYKYTGREFDSATGLQYNRAPYYDPTTGRWISQDPLGFDPGDPNLDRDVGSDATNATDPFGDDFIAVADRPIEGIPSAVKKAAAFLRGVVAGATATVPPPFGCLIRNRLNGATGALERAALALGPFHYSLQCWVTRCCPPERPEDVEAYRNRTRAVKKASVELLAVWNKIPMAFTFNFRGRFGPPLPVLGSPSISRVVRGITITGTLSWRGASVSLTGLFGWPPLSVIYYNQDRGTRILSISPPTWLPPPGSPRPGNASSPRRGRTPSPNKPGPATRPTRPPSPGRRPSCRTPSTGCSSTTATTATTATPSRERSRWLTPASSGASCRACTRATGARCR
jgi:RHS repeat-associated protein